MVSLDRFFSAPALTAAFCLMLAPFLWEVGPKLESRFWPVIKNTRVLSHEVVPEGVLVLLAFEKARDSCDIRELVWMSGPVLLNVERTDQPGDAWRTRMAGEHEQTSPLLIRGVSSLEGTAAVVIHRCHPLWLSRSQFYP